MGTHDDAPRAGFGPPSRPAATGGSRSSAEAAPPQDADRRAAVKKLVIGATLVWSAPVIAATQAAAAASSCVPTQALADTAPTGVEFATRSYGPPRPVNVTLSSTLSNSTANAPNRTVVSSKGGLAGRAIAFDQEARTGASQTVTLTFRDPGTGKVVPVSDVRFTLTDIDALTGSSNIFRDHVEVSGTFTIVSKGSSVSGLGTVASPFQPVAPNTTYDDDTSPNGNVALRFPGPLSSVSFRWFNGATTAGSNPASAVQRLFLAAFSFCR